MKEGGKAERVSRMKKGKRKKKTLGRFRSNNIGFVPKIVRIVRRGVIGLFFSGSDGGITKKKKVDVDPRKESYKRVSKGS